MTRSSVCRDDRRSPRSLPFASGFRGSGAVSSRVPRASRSRPRRGTERRGEFRRYFSTRRRRNHFVDARKSLQTRRRCRNEYAVPVSRAYVRPSKKKKQSNERTTRIRFHHFRTRSPPRKICDTRAYKVYIRRTDAYTYAHGRVLLRSQTRGGVFDAIPVGTSVHAVFTAFRCIEITVEAKGKYKIKRTRAHGKPFELY